MTTTTPLEIDWNSVEAHHGLVPRETIKKFLIEATNSEVEVEFLEPGQMCMYQNAFYNEIPYSSGNKITKDEALAEALNFLLEARQGRNVIAFRQATVQNRFGIRFYGANVLAAMYTKKK